MMREFGMDTLDRLADYIIESSRTGMVAEIRDLPNGTYHNSMRIDGYENPIDLVAALTIRDEIEVDFTGTSGISSLGINVPLT